MKEMVEERLIELSKALEYMMQLEESIEQINWMKVLIKKAAYESLNLTDTALNLSKGGVQCVEELKSYKEELARNLSETTYLAIDRTIGNLGEVLGNIHDTALSESEMLHRMEGEVACYGDKMDELEGYMFNVGDSLRKALACAEMLMAMDIE